MTFRKLFCLLVILLPACRSKNVRPVTIVNAKLPYIDSILRYDTGVDVKIEDWKKDSLEGGMFITDINKIRVAIVAFENSTWYCYVKTNGAWMLSDSFKNNQYPFEFCLTDLNGDGYDDIRLSCPVMRGNNVCTVLLYQPQYHIFRHNSYYDQMNIGYDSATHLVRASALGGLFDNRKELYKVTGDSLTFYKGIEMIINTSGSVGELIYYEGKAGNKTEVKTIKERGNKTTGDFNKECWDDDLNYFSNGRCL